MTWTRIRLECDSIIACDRCRLQRASANAQKARAGLIFCRALVCASNISRKFFFFFFLVVRKYLKPQLSPLGLIMQLVDDECRPGALGSLSEDFALG